MRMKPTFYLPIVLQQILSYNNYCFTSDTILHILLFVNLKKKRIVAYRPLIASTTSTICNAYRPFCGCYLLFIALVEPMLLLPTIYNSFPFPLGPNIKSIFLLLPSSGSYYHVVDFVPYSRYYHRK